MHIIILRLFTKKTILAAVLCAAAIGLFLKYKAINRDDFSFQNKGANRDVHPIVEFRSVNENSIINIQRVDGINLYANRLTIIPKPGLLGYIKESVSIKNGDVFYARFNGNLILFFETRAFASGINENKIEIKIIDANVTAKELLKRNIGFNDCR